MKEMKERVLMILLMALLVVVTPVAFTDCGGGEGPTGPSSNTSCEGYGGGDERGKWARRGSDEVREYTGTVERTWYGGILKSEVPYRKPQYNKITTELSGRTYYNCFEVNGDVMRMDVATFDRVK